MHSHLPAVSRRKLLLGAAASAVALPAFAQAAPLRVRYQLDWRFEAAAIPYIVALRKGYFLQEGLDVSLSVGSGSAGTVTRLAGGSADMGTGDLNALAEFAGNNPNIPAKAVMLIYENTAASVIALKKSGIRTPADLKGKRIAAPVSDSGRKLFPLFAAANKLDAEKDIQWLSVEPALRETMLAREQTDAITANVASGLISLQKLGVPQDQVVVMKYPDYGVPLYGNAILSNTNFLRENPKAVAAFLRAYLRALKETNLDRKGGVAMLKAHEPLVDEATETTRFDLVMDYEIGSPNVKKNGIGDIDLVRYQKGIDMLSGVLGFKSKPDPASLIDLSLMPARAERMVF